MKHIIAFTGSNNPNSIHEKLLHYIIKKFSTQNIDFIDLKKYNAPIYSQKVEQNGIPNPIRELYKIFTEADAFIIASPEHNGLPTAFLKNIIDWLSRIDQKFLAEKSILLISTSPGITGGKTHLQLLANLIPRWGGNLIGQYSLGSFSKNFNEETLSIENLEENKKLEKIINVMF